MQFCFKDFCEYADRVRIICKKYHECSKCYLKGTASCHIACVPDMSEVLKEFKEACERSKEEFDYDD